MMPADNPSKPELEQDSRFPSGPWTGFFLQPTRPGRHWMELTLIFRGGIVQGEGRDVVGKFNIKGRYEVSDGKCRWTKVYVGKHSLFYNGYNEGRGIWGLWEQTPEWKGGFHIWPMGMSDPSRPTLAKTQKLPSPAHEADFDTVVDAEAETVETATATFEGPL